ncbi:hypothetical protein HK096_008089, partial [Nowakowskiella sp. JEL0078]
MITENDIDQFFDIKSIQELDEEQQINPSKPIRGPGGIIKWVSTNVESKVTKMNRPFLEKLIQSFNNRDDSKPDMIAISEENNFRVPVVIGWTEYRSARSTSESVFSDTCLQASFSIKEKSKPNFPSKFRHIKLAGFTVCPALNQAKFDAWVKIRKKFLQYGIMRMIQAKANSIMVETEYQKVANEILENILPNIDSIQVFKIPNKCILVHTIEAAALKIVDWVKSKTVNVYDDVDLLRFACYSAAQGNTIYSKILDSKENKYASLLRSVHPESYFPFLKFEINEKEHDSLKSDDWCENLSFATENDEIPRFKNNFPHYRLAFIVMGYRDWENIAILLNRIYSKNVLIGIHIDDDHFYELQDRLLMYITARFVDHSNIIFFQNPVKVVWGHVSMVYAELKVIFELLKIGTWDYIINLSEHDYPLKTNSQIHDELEKRFRKGFSHLRIKELKLQKSRLESINWLQRGAGSNDKQKFQDYSNFPNRNFPCPSWQIQVFNSQWFVISRRFAEELQHSIGVVNLLAYLEHAYIPDESFFALVFMNTPWKNQVLFNHHRLYNQSNRVHPKSLDFSDRAFIEKNSDNFF